MDVARAGGVMTGTERVRVALEGSFAVAGSSDAWPDPRPLPTLLPVPAFVSGLLPSGLRDWALDVAERVGCPVEYTAAAALVAAGAVIGRARGIRPKRHDDWTVISNLWGALVGSPGEKKSPALKEALTPLLELERAARNEYDIERRTFDTQIAIHKARREAIVKQAQKPRADATALTTELARLDANAPSEPIAKRILINDATVEAVAVVLQGNPRGALQWRDELVGWFASFDKPGHENDRQFYLEAWDGNGEHSFDRITRRSGYVRGLCLGVIGTIQPGPLASYLRASAGGGSAHDGLMQRFQVTVYPDASTNRRGVDRVPDASARTRYRETFTRLAALPDPGDKVVALAFDRDAQDFMDGWAQDLESVIRAAEGEHSVLGAHFAKYRSLGPSLALICELCDGDGAAVSLDAAKRAAALCGWLEAHARRIYGVVLAGPVPAADHLLEQLSATGDLPHPFTARDIYRREWSGLGNATAAETALGVLEAHGWVRSTESAAGSAGGRPTRVYYLHPQLARRQ
jgi:putative DNA primase/helicase